MGDQDTTTTGGGKPKSNRRKKKKQSITGRRVQTFGKKKHAIAIALCGDGHGMIRVKGGGHVAQIYAVRQAVAKALLAFHAKYIDEASKQELRKTFLQYDRNLLVADPRRRESK